MKRVDGHRRHPGNTGDEDMIERRRVRHGGRPTLGPWFASPAARRGKPLLGYPRRSGGVPKDQLERGATAARRGPRPRAKGQTHEEMGRRHPSPGGSCSWRCAFPAPSAGPWPRRPRAGAGPRGGQGRAESSPMPSTPVLPGMTVTGPAASAMPLDLERDHLLLLLAPGCRQKFQPRNPGCVTRRLLRVIITQATFEVAGSPVREGYGAFFDDHPAGGRSLACPGRGELTKGPSADDKYGRGRGRDQGWGNRSGLQCHRQPPTFTERERPRAKAQSWVETRAGARRERGRGPGPAHGGQRHACPRRGRPGNEGRRSTQGPCSCPGRGRAAQVRPGGHDLRRPPPILIRDFLPRNHGRNRIEAAWERRPRSGGAESPAGRRGARLGPGLHDSPIRRRPRMALMARISAGFFLPYQPTAT